MPVNVYSTSSFDRVAKKLHAKEKKGDLSGVFVYKFKLNHQQTLLAYNMQPNKLKPVAATLLYVDSHGGLGGKLMV